jgi:hypothetical protein
MKLKLSEIAHILRWRTAAGEMTKEKHILDGVITED